MMSINLHKKIRNIQQQAYRPFWEKENPEKLKKYRRKNFVNHRKIWYERNQMSVLKTIQKALDIYNNKCQECDVNNLLCLEFHHIKQLDKKEAKNTVTRRIVRANKQLDDIQLLCANHHILADHRDKTSNRGGYNIES